MLARLPAVPFSYRARRRRIEDRRRLVAAQPDRATLADVVDLLRRGGVSMTEARRLTDAAQAGGVPAPRLYRWLCRLGTDLRAVVCSSGLADDELVRHAADDTVPSPSYAGRARRRAG